MPPEPRPAQGGLANCNSEAIARGCLGSSALRARSAAAAVPSPALLRSSGLWVSDCVPRSGNAQLRQLSQAGLLPQGHPPQSPMGAKPTPAWGSCADAKGILGDCFALWLARRASIPRALPGAPRACYWAGQRPCHYQAGGLRCASAGLALQAPQQEGFRCALGGPRLSHAQKPKGAAGVTRPSNPGRSGTRNYARSAPTQTPLCCLARMPCRDAVRAGRAKLGGRANSRARRATNQREQSPGVARGSTLSPTQSAGLDTEPATWALGPGSGSPGRGRQAEAGWAVRTQSRAARSWLSCRSCPFAGAALAPKLAMPPVAEGTPQRQDPEHARRLAARHGIRAQALRSGCPRALRP